MIQPPIVQGSLMKALTARVEHGFFGRKGGVSEGLYASLNVGVGSDDADAAIAANRQIVQDAFGADALLSCYQVHGTDVMTVTEPWTERPRADAMATNRPGLALCILTADCTPVLFADSEAGVIGAAHAGWKGAVAGVLESCLDAMEALGANRSDIQAAIGPCIHQASYEVGPDLKDAVLHASDWAGRFFAPGAGDRWQFDLPGYAHARLVRTGCGAIETLPHDTCAMAEDYFSNRRRNHAGEPDYGRNASVIMLKR